MKIMKNDFANNLYHQPPGDFLYSSCRMKPRSPQSTQRIITTFYKYCQLRSGQMIACQLSLPAIILSILKHNVINVDLSNFKDVIDTPEGHVVIYRLSKLEEWGIRNVSRLPYSIKIVLESLLRHLNGNLVTEEDIKLCCDPKKKEQREIPFIPARYFSGFYRGSCYCGSFCHEIRLS